MPTGMFDKLNPPRSPAQGILTAEDNAQQYMNNYNNTIQGINEQADSVDSFQAGFSTMSAVADLHRYFSRVDYMRGYESELNKRGESIDQLTDKQGWIGKKLDGDNPDIPYDVLVDIADDSRSEVEAEYRIGQYKETMDRMKTMNDNSFAGYAGAGFGIASEILIGGSVIGGGRAAASGTVRLTANAPKLNAHAKALQVGINSRSAGAAMGASEAVAYTALANDTQQTEGGYTEALILGGVLGGLFKGTLPSERLDGRLDVPTDATSVIVTKSDVDQGADAQAALKHNSIMGYSPTNKEYAQDLNTSIGKLEESKEVNIKTIDDYKLQASELEDTIKLARSERDVITPKSEDFFEDARKLSSKADDEDDILTKSDIDEFLGRNKVEVDQKIADDLKDFISNKETPKSKAVDNFNNLVEAERKISVNAKAADSRINKLEEDLVEINKSIDTHSMKLKDDIATIKASQELVEEVNLKNPNDKLDLSTERYISAKQKQESFTSKHADMKNTDVDKDLMTESDLMQNHTLGDVPQLKEIARGARENGDEDFAKNIELTPVMGSDGELKRLGELTEDELKEFGAGVEKSFTATQAQGMARFFDSVGSTVRNSDNETVRAIGSRLIGIRGTLSGESSNIAAASTVKETFATANRNTFQKEMFAGYEQYLKEVKNRSVNTIDKTWVSLRDDFRDYSNLVGKHQLIYQANPSAAAEMPQSVQKASRAISKQIGQMKAEIRKRGWDEGEFFQNANTGEEFSSMSRVVNSGKVRTMRADFDSENINRFYYAAEGSLVSANPKWVFDDALDRLQKVQSTLTDTSAKAKVDLQIQQTKDIQKLSNDFPEGHAKADFIINELNRIGVNRSTKVIGKTLIENAIRRSSQVTDSVQMQKSLNIDELLEELQADTIGVKKELSKDERDILDSILTTHQARKGDTDGKQNEFYGRLKMDPSFTVKGNNINGQEVDISYMSMLSTDANGVVGNSIRTLSSSYGLASQGIRNMDEFNKLINTGKKAADTQADKAKAKKEIDSLEATRKYFNEEQFFDADTMPNRFVQISKKMFNTKLGKLFLNIMPESANIKRVVGADTLNLPVVKVLFQTYAGTFNKALAGLDKDMINQLDALGLISTSDINMIIRKEHMGLEPNVNNNRDWGIDHRSQLSKVVDKIDNFADGVNAGMLQTYRPFERTQRQVFAKMAIQGMVNQARKGGLSSMNDSLRKRAMDYGIDDKFFSDLNKAIDAGHITTNSNGTITKINADDMRLSNPKFFDKFTSNLNNEITSNLLHDTFERSPVWTHGQLFAVFGQFRSFQLLSLNHVLRYDMSRMDATVAATFMWGGLLGALNYAANETISGRGQDLDAETAFTNALRRNSQTAIMTMLADTVLDVAGQDKIFEGASTTGVHGFLDVNSTTVVSFSNSIYNTIRETSGIITGEDPAQSQRKAIKAFYRMIMPNLPFADYPIRELTEE